MTVATIPCKCPWCGWRWTALAPANLALFKTCPNPTLLPADVRSQKVSGKPGRLCRGDLRRVVFTLTPSGAWGKPA